jgi:hypothetical protein
LEKKTELNFFLNKKQNQTETGSNDWFWFGSIRFGFLGKKTGSNQVWFGFGSVFSTLAWFFPVWVGFFPVWVRFSFFGFRFIKPKPNRTGQLFQNFNRFFWLFFFLVFFNRFFSFFTHS